ncbi:hypothetical protein ACFQXB_14440 [Plastorhodobacter daqingensis]|uniref:CPBP family intramembrane metalloprotease n=1 Tax=Plastorhodobacter daqingensis TaxID=1387281 RepID=A0ABW2UMT4_9RHOB
MKGLFRTLVIVAAAWSASSLGYFWLLPVLGVTDGYNQAPVAFAAYYGAWGAAVFAILRRRLFAQVNSTVARAHLLPAAALAAAFALFASVGLPNLPGMRPLGEQGPSEVHFATPAYFLPKSMEILFQQILAAAIVLELRAHDLSLRAITLLVSLMFGGFHLTLVYVYGEASFAYRFTVAALLFGATIPYLMLRVPRGFLLSFGVHWCFYAWLALLNTPP